jgi:hypothetical protein
MGSLCCDKNTAPAAIRTAAAPMMAFVEPRDIAAPLNDSGSPD